MEDVQSTGNLNDFKLTEDTVTGGNEEIVTSTYEQLLVGTRSIKSQVNIDKELNIAANHPVFAINTSNENNIEVADQGFVKRIKESGGKSNSYLLVDSNRSTSAHPPNTYSSLARNGSSNSGVLIGLHEEKEASTGIYSEIADTTDTKEQQQGLPHGHEPSASPDVNDASAVYTEVCEDETYAEVTTSYSTTSGMLSIMESRREVHEQNYARWV